MTHPESQADLTAGEERGVEYIMDAIQCYAEAWARGQFENAANTRERIRKMLTADAIARRAALPPVAAK